MLRLALFELASVQIPIKKIPALVGNAIETTRHALNKTIASQQRQAVASMRLGGNIQVIESKWGKVPLMLDCLEDAFVDGIHPLSTLSHIFGVLRVAHRCADGLSDGAYSFIDSAIQASRNAQQAPIY